MSLCLLPRDFTLILIFCHMSESCILCVILCSCLIVRTIFNNGPTEQLTMNTVNSVKSFYLSLFLCWHFQYAKEQRKNCSVLNALTVHTKSYESQLFHVVRSLFFSRVCAHSIFFIKLSALYLTVHKTQLSLTNCFELEMQ